MSVIKPETNQNASEPAITFSIDGQAMQAAPGETILQVAERHGVQIPTLCHSKKTSHNTSCFVCVVKDETTGRFLPSCAARPSEGQTISSESSEVLDMRRTALNLLLSEHSGDCEAPCTVSCPARASVEEYIREGKNGNFEASLKIIKERIPLPLSIGRVCPRFCEQDCRRNIKDAPVGINEFKRLAADVCYDTYMEERKPLGNRKVAIIGGGPAGLATAYFLRLEGIQSHIIEAMPKLGGMLRYGIPEYRLPKAVLEQELAHFDRMGGITHACNQKLGQDVHLDQLKQEYDAVAITIGCWQASSMRCEGDELAEDGIDWLSAIALNDWKAENPKKTIVVGGGNTAMDCVRTAVRLGSDSVTCMYRRTEKEMPAEDIEIKEAKEEGVNFDFLTAPTKLRREGELLVLTCIRMELGEPDASGRCRPVPVEGSEFEVSAHTIIAAVGQKTDAHESLKTNKWGDIDVSADTLCMDGNVYAAGDCVSGAATVVEAVAGAYKIAKAMGDAFEDRPHTEPPVINVSRGHWRSLASKDLVLLKEASDVARLELEHISIAERKSSMTEITKTTTPERLAQEGERCFECSCTAKTTCALKAHSESCGATPDAIQGEKIISAYDTRHAAIIHDPNKCIKCGICIKTCESVLEFTLLGFKKRGFSTEVGPAFGRPLPAACGDCMACIDECPVGALDRRIKQ